MHERYTLVVDDDDHIREAIRDTLAAEGYQTDEARSGHEALEYLRTHRLPSLILLDWNMAHVNGPQFMEELARDDAFSSIPVVLLTADVRGAKEARQYGFAGILTKPVRLDALFEIIHRYCD